MMLRRCSSEEAVGMDIQPSCVKPHLTTCIKHWASSHNPLQLYCVLIWASLGVQNETYSLHRPPISCFLALWACWRFPAVLWWMAKSKCLQLKRTGSSLLHRPLPLFLSVRLTFRRTILAAHPLSRRSQSSPFRVLSPPEWGIMLGWQFDWR